MNKTFAALVGLLILLSIAPLVHAEDGKINIVATLEIYSYFAKEIGGERVKVSFIVPQGEDIHSYSLTYSDIKKLDSANLIILSSSEFFSIDTNIKAKVKNKIILDFTDYHAVIYPLGNLQKNIHGYWLYPPNAVNITLAIKNKLEEIDPSYSSYYEENFLKFKKELENTLEKIKVISKECKLNEKTALLTVPGAFYVAKYLGISIEGTILEGPHQFISEDELNKVKKDIENGRINYIINIEGLATSKAGQIAIQLSKETGVKIVYIDIFSTANYSALLLKDASILSGANYVESYGNKGSGCEFYIMTVILLIITSLILFVLANWYRKELLK